MGTALAPGKPLLLTSIVRSGRQKGPGRQRPGLFVLRPMEPRAAFVRFLLERNAFHRWRETIFVAATCFCIISLN
jgi:hypothetical protein